MIEDGEHIKYDYENKISSKTNYLNGKRNGEYISYLNGEIKYIKNYLNNKRHGETIRYYDINEKFKTYHINGTKKTYEKWIEYCRNIKLEEIGL
jgi:antitoxin component YwqK of YwqJK toxin-antitoxin module